MTMNDNWPRPRHPKARDFAHISDAYAYVRENNKPIVVRLPDSPCMANRLAKLYPSGGFVAMSERKSTNVGNAIIHYVRSEE